LSPASEPSLWGSSAAIVGASQDGQETTHQVTLGIRSHPLLLGQEPTELELLWYGRVLAGMLLRPGKHSKKILEELARRVLIRFSKKGERQRYDLLIEGAIDALWDRNTRYPVRNFISEGTTLDAVIDEVMRYVTSALLNNARDWLQIEALRAVPVMEQAPADQNRYQDSINDRLDHARDHDADDVYYIGFDTAELDITPMPAPSTARSWKKKGWAESSVPTVEEVRAVAARHPDPPPSSRSAKQLAKELEIARTTVLSAIERAKASGIDIKRTGRGYIILDEQVAGVRAFLPKTARKPYPRIRGQARAKYPAGAIIFGGDVAPGTTNKA
jgi:hypothetical protein